MSDFLIKMKAKQKERLQYQKQRISLGFLCDQLLDIPPVLQIDFNSDQPSVIAEIKFSSPSLGVIYPQISDVLAIARSYVQHGAACLSILTEEDFFQGSLSYVADCRQALPKVPILRKDFLIDPYQVYEARAAGADVILIIMAMLQDEEAQALYQTALDLGMQVIVEVHHEEDLARAQILQPQIIGVNCRNLSNMVLEPQIHEQLLTQRLDKQIWIAESGIHHGQRMKDLYHKGYKGFLVGTSLMKEKEPGFALKNLWEEYVHAN